MMTAVHIVNDILCCWFILPSISHVDGSYCRLHLMKTVQDEPPVV